MEMVTHNHDGRETKTTTAFYYFCYPIDCNYAFFQVRFVNL